MSTATSVPRRHGWLAWVSPLVVLAGPVSYLLTLEQPFLRRTGALAFLLVGLGVLLALRGALFRHRAGVPLLAVNLGLAAACTFAFFGLARLPAATPVEPGQPAPEFTLADTSGTRWSLREARRDGPVLLVFYRGFW